MIRKRKRNEIDKQIIIGDIVIIKDSLTYENSGIKDSNLYNEVAKCFNYKVVNTTRGTYGEVLFEIESNEIIIKPKYLSKKVRLVIKKDNIERIL